MCMLSEPTPVAIMSSSHVSEVKNTKTVRFGGKSSVAAPAHYSLDNAQKAIMWHNKSELKVVKKSIKKIMKAGPAAVANSSQDCYRGIEVFENSNRTTRREQCVVPIVKMHQEGRAMGHADDERGLRSFAAILNRQACDQAVSRGAQDAVEAFSIYEKDQDQDYLKISQQCFQLPNKCSVAQPQQHRLPSSRLAQAAWLFHGGWCHGIYDYQCILFLQ